MAAGLLGDLGAEVIKIERRESGDPMRGIMDVFFQSERNPQYETINRNKRGMVLDLGKQEGREVVHKLAQKSDVFLHNFRSRAANRLGLDYETLSRLNPRLVYAQASAWGLRGPDSEKPGFDAAAQARAGIMYLVGEPGVAKPRQVPPMALSDMSGALCLALGIVAALQARERLGRGQMVDTSIFGSTITLATWAVTFTLSCGVDPTLHPRATVDQPLYYFYECADGEWI
ncbi:MAG: hypothetical protein E3J34_01785 [Dehalococcoidia bacterium]|nr:MAG: hypothetical protein E3J34_01785 [Dehalococcoidia bacterium]